MATKVTLQDAGRQQRRWLDSDMAPRHWPVQTYLILTRGCSLACLKGIQITYMIPNHLQVQSDSLHNADQLSAVLRRFACLLALARRSLCLKIYIFKRR